MTRRSPRALVLLCTLLGSACPGSQPAPSATAAPPQAPRSPWVKARSAQSYPLLEAPARALGPPDAKAEIVSPFRGRVVRIHIRPGQEVQKGSAIVDVVMPDLVRAAGSYLAASTRHQAYERHLNQLRSLRSEGMVRLIDLAEAENKVAEALSDQQGALGTLRAADLQGNDAARLLGSGGIQTLRSPIAGMVVAVRASLGETHENTDLALAEIAGSGAIQIEARLARAIPSGAELVFLTPAGEQVPLKLLATAKVVDPRDGTTLCWLAPQGTTTLTPGQQGRLRVSLSSTSAAVVIPARAVDLREGQARVYLPQPGKDVPLSLAVEVLSTSGTESLVRGELRPGQEVAADVSLLRMGEGEP